MHRFRQPAPWYYSTAMATHSFLATVGIVYAVIAPLVPLVTMLYFILYVGAYTYTMQVSLDFIFMSVKLTGIFRCKCFYSFFI
jgi:hypothetical protein